MRYLIVLAVTASLGPTSASAEETPRKLKPVITLTGTDSKQIKESFARCGSQMEWVDTWHKHKGGDAEVDRRTCPVVDFESYIVVAIFHGKSSVNEGITVMAVTDETDCVRVRYRPSWFQTAFSSKPKSYDTQSYAFVVLPKSPKVLVLEEDVRDNLREPPIWKERARLASEKK